MFPFVNCYTEHRFFFVQFFLANCDPLCRVIRGDFAGKLLCGACIPYRIWSLTGYSIGLNLDVGIDWYLHTK